MALKRMDVIMEKTKNNPKRTRRTTVALCFFYLFYVIYFLQAVCVCEIRFFLPRNVHFRFPQNVSTPHFFFILFFIFPFLYFSIPFPLACM